MEKIFTVEELKGKKIRTLEKLLLEHKGISIECFEEWENINNIKVIKWHTDDDGQTYGYTSGGFTQYSLREFVIFQLTRQEER
jgi:hypothetical protein